jgi:ATP-dependent RNA helicase RhlE
MSFSSLGLSEVIIQGVYGSGYCTPTEIQEKAIPLVLNGKDIIGCAPTGTGKTVAFVLPVLNSLVVARLKQFNKFPRVLILVPTRELVLQIEESIKTCGMYTETRTASIYGGVGIGKQLQALENGTDIVVATPGRLLDHLDRRSVNLSCIEILILDEADKMYEMGFVKDVRTIINSTPKTRQTLLFSATMSTEIRALTSAIQKNPHTIEIGTQSAPVETVSQEFYSITESNKLDLLTFIIRNETIESILVFCRTKYGADRIAKALARRGITVAAIHADRSQAHRKAALDGFKSRKFKVLVATDLASRGIDVERISHVLNYDTPLSADDYIHRIGRTGRAETIGNAITFVSPNEEKFFTKIESHTGKQYGLKQYPGFKYYKSTTPSHLL